MAGEFFSASSKALRKLLSDSPASLLMISGPLNEAIIDQCHEKIKYRNNVLNIVNTEFGNICVYFALNLYTVDKEEESSSLVGNGTCNEGLSSTRRSVQENTTRWLHSDSFEQGRMPQGQFHHFLDLGELLAHAADIIVTHCV